MNALFRTEAVDGQRQSWLGEVRLARPLSLTLLTVFAVGVAALLITYLFVGEYTRRVRLAGALVLSSDTSRPGLQALLYAPASSVGLLREGQPVRLRYEALPALFPESLATGTVVRVARTPALPGECAACTFAGGQSTQYRIEVAIDAQPALAEGQASPWAAGMRADAEVLLERRRIVDWLFEPLRAVPARGA